MSRNIIECRNKLLYANIGELNKSCQKLYAFDSVLPHTHTHTHTHTHSHTHTHTHTLTLTLTHTNTHTHTHTEREKKLKDFSYNIMTL